MVAVSVLLSAWAAQASADMDICGDGMMTGGEMCDDGPYNGQPGYCDANCMGYSSYCGDGFMDGSEMCDDGPYNGMPGYCDSTCSGYSSYCGDGFMNGSEMCDDGPYNGQPGYCDANCMGYSSYCGDGFMDGSEMCDDGPYNGMPGYCDSTCSGYSSYCGDGFMSGSEMCDDGYYNGQPGYCDATCSGYTAYCGDGVVSGTEICDDGGNNGMSGYCNATCTDIPARTPFSDAKDAPILQALSYGHVLGSRDYQANFSLGELPGVGLAPGFAVAIRLTSNGAAGSCGAACELLISSAAADDDDYLITEQGGNERRFEPNGGSWTEVAPRAGIPFRSATLAILNGNIVVSEFGGNMTRTFDADGHEIERSTPWGALSLGYDSNGRLSSATNAAGATLSLSYDSTGRISSVTDPLGFTMTAVYAGSGHLVSIEGPADAGVTPNIAIGWSNDDIVSVTRLGFNPIQLTYDNGLVASVSDQDGNAYAFQSIDTEIEMIDSSQQYSRQVYSGHDLVSVETGAGAQISYTRDAFGRITEVHYATDGADRVQLTAYDSDGNVTSVTDAEGRTNTFAYDGSGNLVSSTDAEGHTTSHSYNANNWLIATTDPLGRTATTTHDANGLPIASSFLGVTTSRTYNARGQVATSTDAFGVITSYGYDSEGRLSSESRPGSPAVSITRTPQGNGEQIVVSRGGDSSTTVTDHYGRVVSVSSSLGAASSYSYDPVTGLRASESQTFRGATQSSSRTFTNTGDAAQVWINGEQRQAAPRIVPPGFASFGMEGGGINATP